MALESLPKIAPALFSAEQDLIEIYNKKSDTRGTINPSYIKSSPSGVSGAIQFSDGSAFSSDASNLFWDNTNKRFGVGTSSPTAKLTIGGTLVSGFGLELNDGSYRGSFTTNNGGTSLQGWSNGLTLGANGRDDMKFTWDGNNYSTSTSFTFGASSSLGAKLGIKGSGSTSATTSLLVQNSAGAESLKVADNRVTTVYGLGVNSYPNIGQVHFNLSDTCIISTPSNINFKSGITDQSVFFLSAGNSAIGINTTSPNASASFDISSTTKGFLPPRMTTTQKNAISSPAIGLMVFDTDLGRPCFYNGAWVTL